MRFTRPSSAILLANAAHSPLLIGKQTRRAGIWGSHAGGVFTSSLNLKNFPSGRPPMRLGFRPPGGLSAERRHGIQTKSTLIKLQHRSEEVCLSLSLVWESSYRMTAENREIPLRPGPRGGLQSALTRLEWPESVDSAAESFPADTG